MFMTTTAVSSKILAEADQQAQQILAETDKQVQQIQDQAQKDIDALDVKEDLKDILKKVITT